MDRKFALKYKRVLDILNDVAECAQNNLILVGGTALALFYLKHMVSIDLDFVPIEGEEIKLKEMLKGCLTKKGYRTSVARYKNQFIIQFEDTSIKIEIFTPKRKIKKINNFKITKTTLAVASLEDILEQKIDAYETRKSTRDLYDIVFILKNKGSDFALIRELLAKYGKPENEEEIKNYTENGEDYNFFKKVTKDAS